MFIYWEYIIVIKLHQILDRSAINQLKSYIYLVLLSKLYVSLFQWLVKSVDLRCIMLCTSANISFWYRKIQKQMLHNFMILYNKCSLCKCIHYYWIWLPFLWPHAICITHISYMSFYHHIILKYSLFLLHFITVCICYAYYP